MHIGFDIFYGMNMFEYTTLLSSSCRRHRWKARTRNMIMSSNGNIFPTQRPVTRSFDVLFDLRPNKRLSKQSWGWWFETPSRPSWCHCNEKLWCGREWSQWKELQATEVGTALGVLGNMYFHHGPLTRYVKLQVAHAPGMPGTFSPAADFKGNR